MKLSDYSVNAYKKNSGESLKENRADSDSSGVILDIKGTKNAVSLSNAAAISGEALLKEVKEKNGLLKVPEQKDSVYRRVAKFLMIIGVDEAAKILPHLSQEQTEKVISEFSTIKKIEKQEASLILEEFQSLMVRARENGGVNTARVILEKAFGEDKAEKLIDKAVPFKNGRPFSYLEQADSDKLTALLKDESPALQALVCSYLKPESAASFIKNLNDSQKKEIILRLAKLEKNFREDIEKTTDKQQYIEIDWNKVVLEKKFNSLAVEKADSLDGRNILAQILKKMDSASEEKIITSLSDKDPELGNDLRQRLFTLEDVLNADDRFIQNKLKDYSDRDIACLIAGKSAGFREKILFNVSSVRRKDIELEEERCRPFLKSDVEKTTSLFFCSLRRAWEEGKLIIKGRDDELYVQ